MNDLHILPGRGDGRSAHSRPRPAAHSAQFEPDEVYFARRSTEERERAQEAADDHLRALHLDLAGRYAQMAAAIKEAGDKIGR